MKMFIRSTPAQRIVVVVCLGLGTHWSCAVAQTCPAPSNNQIFNLSLCTEGQVASVGGNSLLDIIDEIDEDRIRNRIPTYDEGVSAGEFRLDIRGLPVTLRYGSDSTELYFTVPSLGINQTFDGGTRDESNDLFEDYIKNEGDDILRELLRVSAVDPLAGNPASVQSQMAATAFSVGVDPVYDTLSPGSSFGLGARFGSYSLGQFTQNVFTLPIDYAYTFSNYDKLIVSAPLTYMEVDGAHSYRGNLGIAYKKNILQRWALTAAVTVHGVAGRAGAEVAVGCRGKRSNPVAS